MVILSDFLAQKKSGEISSSYFNKAVTILLKNA